MTERNTKATIDKDCSLEALWETHMQLDDHLTEGVNDLKQVIEDLHNLIRHPQGARGVPQILEGRPNNHLDQNR